MPPTGAPARVGPKGIALLTNACRDPELMTRQPAPLGPLDRLIGPEPAVSFMGYREMAEKAREAVTSFEIRHQFVDGDTDGLIVRGELIYDAEALQAAGGST